MMRALPDRALRSGLGDQDSPTRSKAHADQRRRILRATGELVAKRGYRAVTVELIAKRAKVSYSTFYKHFENKEAAFLELFDSVFETTRRRVEQALELAGEAWPERVGAALRAIVEQLGADPLLARAVIVEALAAGPTLLQRYQQAGGALVPLLAEGRALNPRGENLPSTLEGTLAGSALWSIYQQLILGEADRIEALLPEVLELVLRPYIGVEQAAVIAASAAAKAAPGSSGPSA